tara:strand:- start:2587 stop:3132 length:546 start_codon:yes stop_codon:yes gene_type:complete
MKIANNRCEFEISNTCTFTANAIRRALLSDIETVAPNTILIKENTSCQTDEYICHRIGLIPFLQQKEEVNYKEECLTLNVSNRTPKTSDFEGDAFKTIYETDLIKLIDGQTLNIEVYFNRGTAKEHARYSPVAAVGYELQDKKIVFTFESINGECPSVHLKKALLKLQNRLNHVKVEVEMC